MEWGLAPIKALEFNSDGQLCFLHWAILAPGNSHFGGGHRRADPSCFCRLGGSVPVVIPPLVWKKLGSSANCLTQHGKPSLELVSYPHSQGEEKMSKLGVLGKLARSNGNQNGGQLFPC